jgi:hypothetical protein
MIPETLQVQPLFVKHGFESNNRPESPKCISIIKLPNDKWQAKMMTKRRMIPSTLV